MAELGPKSRQVGSSIHALCPSGENGAGTGPSELATTEFRELSERPQWPLWTAVGACLHAQRCGWDDSEEDHSRDVPASSIIVQLDGQVTLTPTSPPPELPEAY